jgi:hypothetical protein
MRYAGDRFGIDLSIGSSNPAFTPVERSDVERPSGRWPVIDSYLPFELP